MKTFFNSIGRVFEAVLDGWHVLKLCRFSIVTLVVVGFALIGIFQRSLQRRTIQTDGNRNRCGLQSIKVLLYETRTITGNQNPIAIPGSIDGTYQTTFHVGSINLRVNF